MPENPQWLPRADILRQEEIIRLASLFVRAGGIEQIRLTGGEPLLRRDVAEIVSELNTLREQGLQRLSMTSNASRLTEFAKPLKDAGLDDINISLDILDPARFAAETGGELAPVLAGIVAAQEAGLPIKLNAVAIKGYNDDQLVSLTRWAMARELELRFIEFMPLDGGQNWSPEKVLSEAEILTKLDKHWAVKPIPREHAPATEYQLEGDYRIGIISTVTNPFCSSCDRLRMTATGDLVNCLFSVNGKNLRDQLRAGADDEELLEIIRGHVWTKESGYRGGYVERPLTMHALGG